jgi:hypothetical protein
VTVTCVMCGHSAAAHGLTGQCSECICPTGWYIAAVQSTPVQWTEEEYDAWNRSKPPEEQRD